MTDRDAWISAQAELLNNALQAIEAQDELERDSQSVVTLDQQSVGRLSRQDALLSQSMAKATQARRDGEKRRIAAALGRIAAGEYGYCSDCGDDIAPARLAHDPAAPKCLDCARG